MTDDKQLDDVFAQLIVEKPDKEYPLLRERG